tara:strand:+ start:635 stop:925 length:291 start_codon:yes stop_codon:yes gene_type:complete
MDDKLVVKLEEVAAVVLPLLTAFRLDLEKVEDAELGESASELAGLITATDDKKKLLSKLAALKLEKKILKDGMYRAPLIWKSVSRGAGPSGVLKIR